MKSIQGTSPVVEGLRLHDSTARGKGLIPSWGTKIPQAALLGQKKTKKTTNRKERKKRLKIDAAHFHEMEIKTAMRYHYIPNRMDKI